MKSENRFYKGSYLFSTLDWVMGYIFIKKQKLVEVAVMSDNFIRFSLLANAFNYVVWSSIFLNVWDVFI